MVIKGKVYGLITRAKTRLSFRGRNKSRVLKKERCIKIRLTAIPVRCGQSNGNKEAEGSNRNFHHFLTGFLTSLPLLIDARNDAASG